MSEDKVIALSLLRKYYPSFDDTLVDNNTVVYNGIMTFLQKRLQDMFPGSDVFILMYGYDKKKPWDNIDTKTGLLLPWFNISYTIPTVVARQRTFRGDNKDLHRLFVNIAVYGIDMSIVQVITQVLQNALIYEDFDGRSHPQRQITSSAPFSDNRIQPMRYVSNVQFGVDIDADLE